MNVPKHLIDHCAKHPMCKGCRLRTCVAPVGVSVTDPRWQEWIDSVASQITRVEGAGV